MNRAFYRAFNAIPWKNMLYLARDCDSNTGSQGHEPGEDDRSSISQFCALQKVIINFDLNDNQKVMEKKALILIGVLQLN
jgi:hypothetical protein